MSISIVQSSFVRLGVSSGSSSHTFVGTLPSPVTAGNTVVIGFAGYDFLCKKTPGTVTDNAGTPNTYIQETFENTTTQGQGWFYLTNVQGGPTQFSVPVTSNNTNAMEVGFAVYELSGVSAVDVGNYHTQTFATSFSSGSFTTTAANDFGLALVANSGNNTTAFTETNGWTTDYTNYTSANGAFAHNTLASAGSNSITGTGSTNDTWYISYITFSPSTSSPLAGTPSDAVTATGALTVKAPLAGAASSATSATGALTVTSPLAAAAVDAITAQGIFSNSVVLAAAASDAVSATAAIIARAAMAGVANSAVTATGQLIAFASVTLVTPLYTGIGGVFDPNIMPIGEWSLGNPSAGVTIFYDPTYITIMPNGEINSTNNNISAFATFFNPAAGDFSSIIIRFTPYNVGYAYDSDTASGGLTAVVTLASSATALSSAVGALIVQANLMANASDAVTAVGLINVTAQLQSAATSLTSAVGAVLIKGSMVAAAMDAATATGQLHTVALLAGNATDATSGTAFLTAQADMNAAAADTVSAIAAVTVKVALLGHLIDVSSAAGMLVATAHLAGAAATAASASAGITVRSILNAAATDAILAAGAIKASVALQATALTRITAAGASTSRGDLKAVALELTTAAATLHIKSPLSGAASDVTSASAFLRAYAPLIGVAVDADSASGGLVDLTIIPMPSPHDWSWEIENDDDNDYGSLSTMTPGDIPYGQVVRPRGRKLRVANSRPRSLH